MKRIVLIIGILLVLPDVALLAKEKAKPSWTVRAWYAMAPLAQVTNYSSKANDFFTDYYYYSSSSTTGRMSFIYKDYSSEVVCPGVFGADFSCSVLKWLELGGLVGITPLSHKNFEALGNTVVSSRKACQLFIMPELHFIYMKKPLVRMYGSLALGGSIPVGFTKTAGYCEFQIAPIAVEVGRRWFGFVETGFGTMYCGIKFGAGYRF